MQLDQAVEWSLKHPEESSPTSTRIHRFKSRSVQSQVARIRKGKAPGAGGQNRNLTGEQAAAIVRFCREAEYTHGATRDMAMAAG